MSEAYWEDLYQKGDTRWEKGEPSPGLVDFLAERPELPKGTVLVPGCGFGHDVRAWAEAGFEATGLDIAPSANRLSKERTPNDLSATFKLANFLTDEPFARFDYLFEHTLFCAIQPAERDAYLDALKRWLRPAGTYVAVFYMIPDEDGPPFGTTREEIKSRFGSDFELLESWVPRSYPNRTDLEWMTVWKSKGSQRSVR
jgi:cyclopropane fatty-acyl-phospholipid synthase-like methyltransferase